MVEMLIMIILHLINWLNWFLVMSVSGGGDNMAASDISSDLSLFEYAQSAIMTKKTIHLNFCHQMDMFYSHKRQNKHFDIFGRFNICFLLLSFKIFWNLNFAISFVGEKKRWEKLTITNKKHRENKCKDDYIYYIYF